DGVFRRRLRLSAAAGSGLLIAAMAAVPASIAAPAADDPVVDVSIDTFTPATPKPGQPVTITGRVTNTSTATFDNPQAIACIDASPMPRKVNTAMVLSLRHRPTLLGNDRYSDESLAQAMAPGGALGRQLAAGQRNKVTWLVDPAMLEEANGMADGYKVLGKDN